jgi:hypothetical protein
MASRQDVINWVSQAWDAVKTEVIIHSFKVCGITAAMDGSEDHLMHDRMARAMQEAARMRVEAGDQTLHMLFDEEGSDSEVEFEGFPDSDNDSDSESNDESHGEDAESNEESGDNE